MDACFADPGAIGRALTADFAGTLQKQEEALHNALEQAAAAVQSGEREVFENTGLATGIFCTLGGGMLAAGIAGAVLAMTGQVSEEMIAAAGAAIVTGVFILALGLFFRRRGRRPVLVLSPTGFRSPGLAEEVGWLDVADFTVFTGNALRVEFLIALGRPMPRKTSRRAQVDASARVVTLPSFGIRGLKPNAYWRAATARAELAQRRAAAAAMPEDVVDDTMMQAPGQG
jgi:hypothetical protein